jgi:hypothetical protein
MLDFLADMPLIICRELYFMHDDAHAHAMQILFKYLE